MSRAPVPDPTGGDHRSRPSLRVVLLLAVNATLLLGLTAFTAVDYQRGLAERLRDTQAGLAEEAMVVLPAVELLGHHGLDRVQAYIDRACGEVQETISPGHHIAVRLNGQTLQARTHGRATPGFVDAMEAAAATTNHRARVGEETILVGSAALGATRVFVSEYTDRVVAAARRRLLARTAGLAGMGLLLTVVVNLILVRLVIRPLRALVHTVRRIGGGDLAATGPRPLTRELGFLSDELQSAGASLEAADRSRRRALAKAHRIQQNLLPEAGPLAAAGVESVYLPAEDVGGDFFDARDLGDDRVAVCIGDVTGHGVPAAMGAAMLKVLFEDASHATADPGEVLDSLNRRFHAVTLDGDFASMFMGVLDRAAGRLDYASAGHEVGYVVGLDGELRELGSTGLLLGVDPDACCDLAHARVAPGETVVLMTDGLTETMSPRSRLLGREPVRRALSAAPTASPRELADTLLRLSDDHREGVDRLDDLTLVVLRV